MKRGILILFVLLVYSGIPYAQEIYQWRGVDRKGVYPEIPMVSFLEEEPEQVLAIAGFGNGYGAPVVTPEGIFVTGEIGDTALVFRYSLSGELIWQTPFGKDWVATYPGSRSSPTIVGDLLYVCSGLGNLACLEVATGECVWIIDTIHGQPLMHGHAESPLVFDDMVYLVAGGRDTNIVAFDRFQGTVKWIAEGRGERAGYNAPNLIRLPERDILVTFSAYHLLGLDARTGELLWTHEQTNIPIEKRKPGAGDTHSNTIYFDEGFIYYFAGDGNGAVKLRLSPNGDSITQVWRNESIDNFMGGVVRIGSYLYSTTMSGRDLRSLSVETGLESDTLKLGSGALIATGNNLIYYSQKGQLNLVRADQGKMSPDGAFQIHFGTKEHFSHPVIFNGILYLRRGDALRGWKIRKHAPDVGF
ncbi:MAG: hypothetical protein EOL88_01610 [Bacteroidia bacterium]|nr:hypothetical protein [Bacteroidia bacterium]